MKCSIALVTTFVKGLDPLVSSQVPCSIVLNTEFGGDNAASIDDNQVGKKAGMPAGTFAVSATNGNQLSGRGMGRRKSGASAKNAIAHFKSSDQVINVGSFNLV